jgi:hypothetical protein
MNGDLICRIGCERAGWLRCLLPMALALIPVSAMADCRTLAVEAETMLIQGNTRYQRALANAIGRGDEVSRVEATYKVTGYIEEGAYSKMIASYKQQCRRGTNMTVPSALGDIWQEQCDFSKSILKSGTSVTCVKK